MKKILKWGLLIFIAIIALGLIFGGGNETPSNNTSETAEVGESNENIEPAVSEQAQSEPVVVDVETIGDAFDSNQVRAENEWGGRLVQFDAEVSNITEGKLAFYNVATDDFSGTQISCTLIEENQLLEVENGQVVTVQGVVGEQFLGVINLNECKIIK